VKLSSRSPISIASEEEYKALALFLKQDPTLEGQGKLKNARRAKKKIKYAFINQEGEWPQGEWPHKHEVIIIEVEQKGRLLQKVGLEDTME